MSKKAETQKRKKGSDKRKNTFNKYGKTTKRGIRIKQTDLENKAANKKALCDNGKHNFKRSDNAGMCKITRRNKKKGGN